MRDPMPGGRPPEAQVLARFLTADPEQWPRLAPRVTEAVGMATLERIVHATAARTGGFGTVTDGPDGLIVSGSTGRVRAWAQVAPDGELTGLRIEGAPYTPPRHRLPVHLAWTVCLVLVAAWNVLILWTAADRTAWAADLATLAAFYVVVEGCGAPAMQPWPLRRAVETGAVAPLASAWGLPGLPAREGLTGRARGLVLLT
ncbi:hypothetical protein ACFV23_56615, partial [Streptomyces sp. NPDC059627]